MAEITKREGSYITIEHTFDLRGDMLVNKKVKVHHHRHAKVHH